MYINVLHQISSNTLDTTLHVAVYFIQHVTFPLRRFFKKLKQISIEEAINLSFEKKIPKSKKSKTVKIDPLQIICRDLTFNKK